MTRTHERSEGGSDTPSFHLAEAAAPGVGRPPTSARHTPPRGMVVKVVAGAQPRPRTNPPVADEAHEPDVAAPEAPGDHRPIR